MVTFVCDLCNESMKKAAVAKHCHRCPAESVSCVDCSVTFPGDDYVNHTQCISENEKYQGKLYKGKQQQSNNNNNNNLKRKSSGEEDQKEEKKEVKIVKKEEKKEEKKEKDDVEESVMLKKMKEILSSSEFDGNAKKKKLKKKIVSSLEGKYKKKSVKKMFKSVLKHHRDEFKCDSNDIITVVASNNDDDKHQWKGELFGDDENGLKRKTKFLSLLGANKKENKDKDVKHKGSSAMTAEEQKKTFDAMQKTFEASLANNRKGGLGFSNSNSQTPSKLHNSSNGSRKVFNDDA